MRVTQDSGAYVYEANTWLSSPGNAKAPDWLRDLIVATRDWVEDVRDSRQPPTDGCVCT